MMRFLHTADWQLGLKLRFIPGDRGAKVRNERFEAVRRIAALAHEHEVDAVVVAGDVFDDNAVGPHTLQATRDALASFAPIPVLLLPGNHDASTPECALARLRPASHIHVALSRDPVHLAGATFYPCPIFHRHEREDPTSWLPPRDDADRLVRIAVAHGPVLDFSESTERPLIDAQGVLDKGFDYLALGDWHGTWSMGPRVWYPGTPEPTRFAERRPGYALLVEIDGSAAAPRITDLPVARTRWVQHSCTFDGDSDLDALDAWFQGLEERALTLVELRLQGALSLAGRGRLDRLLAEQSAELLHLRWNDDDLQDAPSEQDLRALDADGFVGVAAAVLREAGAPVDRDAMRLLYRLLGEAHP
jgi:DNA repair exonuclease SbcCD nuclease subunit